MTIRNQLECGLERDPVLDVLDPVQRVSREPLGRHQLRLRRGQDRCPYEARRSLLKSKVLLTENKSNHKKCILFNQKPHRFDFGKLSC